MHRSAIAGLPAGSLAQHHLLRGRYLIGQEGKLQVFYAPVDGIATSARLVLVGVTPGWRQMKLAFEACRDALKAGRSDEECMRAVKATAAFAGMRNRITAWLDDLGVASWLDLKST